MTLSKLLYLYMMTHPGKKLNFSDVPAQLPHMDDFTPIFATGTTSQLLPPFGGMVFTCTESKD